MKWKLLGYALWAYAVITVIGIPVGVYTALTGPQPFPLTSMFLLALWRLVFTVLLYFLGSFFIRKSQVSS